MSDLTSMADLMKSKARNPDAEKQRTMSMADLYANINGAIGVADHYAGHIPSTLAGLAAGTGRYMTGEKWWEAYPDAINRAQTASKNALADFARRNSRDVAGLAVGEHGASPLHNIIVTLPMAMRKSVQKYLHPDDVGGARRQEAALNEYVDAKIAGAPVDERADIMRRHWTDNGVGFFHPDANRVNTYTSAAVPGTQKLTRDIPPGMTLKGPLGKAYDDPLLYAAHPDAAKIPTSLTVADKNSTGATAFDRVTERPKWLEAMARDPKQLSNVVAHEATHITASNKANALPQGSSVAENMDASPIGMTSRALAKLDKAAEDAASAFHEGRLYDGVDPRRALIAIEEQRGQIMGMMNYLDPIQNPGEYLARMEQIAHRWRQIGRSPFSIPLDQIDDLDLRGGAGLDFRKYKMVPKGRD